MKRDSLLIGILLCSALTFCIGCKDDAGKTVIIPRKRTFPLAMADAPADAPAYTVAAGKAPSSK